MFLVASSSYASDAAIPAAVDWAVGTLLGSVATGLAILAVAFLGFGMLAGRIDWRTWARVVLGIFILFGAPTIARQLAQLARGNEIAQSDQVATQVVPPQRKVPRNAPVADPYAGASIPQP